MATIDDIVNNEQILEIANAIRKVTRTSDPMTVPQMPKRLMEIRATETIEKIISFSSPSPVSLGLYDKEFSHLFVITPKTSNDALLLKRIKPEIQLDVDIEVGEIFLNYKDSQDIELNVLIMDLLLPSSEETKGFLILQGESDIIEPYNTEKSYSKGELFTINKGTDENPIFAIGVTTVSHGREEYNPEHNNILTNQIYDTTTNEYKDLYEVLDSLTELIETKVDKTTTGSTRRVYGVNTLNEQELTDIEATPTNESIKLVTSGGIYSALDGKVDKVEDYGLSKNDYTDADAEKVSKIVIDGDGDKALLDDGSYGEVGKVDTVNGIGPDENKNIEITGENIHLKDITTKTLTKGIEDIETNIGDIEFTLSTLAGLGGDLAAYNFNIATPTQQQLNDYALSQIPSISDPNDIFNNTRVKNLFDGNVWRLTNTPNTEPPVFEWINIGPDMIAPATDLTYGSVMGNDNISFTNGLPTVLKSADADKLGGEAPSHYAKASDLSDKVDKITLGSVRRVYGVNELNEQEATEVEGTPTEDSTKLVTSGGVFTAIDNLDLGEVNIIEEIKVDNVKQTVTDKSVNIDLSGKEDKLPDAPEEDPQDYYLGYDESGNKIAKKVVVSGGSYKSNIYFSNEDSDVVGYKKLSNKVDDALTTFEKTAQASSSPKLIEKFLFDLPAGVDTIDGGDWLAHINCRVDNTDNATRFLFKPFVYHEDGTESYLFTSDDNGVQSAPIKNVAFDWLEIIYTSEQINLDPTDRIGVEVYITTTRPSPTKLEFRAGNGYASHVNLPLAFRHSELRDLDGDINYQHITLDEKQRLAGIESGAEVNKINSIKVNGEVAPVVDGVAEITVSGGGSDLEADGDTIENVEDVLSAIGLKGSEEIKTADKIIRATKIIILD